jgi:hypothetical protein
MEPTATAASWSHLSELLFEGAWDEELRRFRPAAAFRGHGRAARPLAASIVSVGGDIRRKERHLLRNFRKYAHRTFSGDDLIWNWLSLAQHHGLPTRLLDWTYSPYVALHFVTADPKDFECDGEIWMLQFRRTNQLLPATLQDLLREEGSDVFTGEMLASIAPTLGDFDALASNPFVIFLEPPSLDERIVNQAALFSVMSSPIGTLDAWLSAHPGVARRITVPAALKWEIRDKLDQLNVNERVLFPGLDGLSRWLSRYYTERTR